MAPLGSALPHFVIAAIVGTAISIVSSRLIIAVQTSLLIRLLPPDSIVWEGQSDGLPMSAMVFLFGFVVLLVHLVFLAIVLPVRYARARAGYHGGRMRPVWPTAAIAAAVVLALSFPGSVRDFLRLDAAIMILPFVTGVVLVTALYAVFLDSRLAAARRRAAVDGLSRGEEDERVR